MDPDRVFSQDNNATPGLAIGTIAGDTEPTIFVAFEANSAVSTFPSVSIVKSKVSQIATASGWSAPISFPGPADSVSIFHPAVALDPVANLLDVLVKLTEPGDGDDHTAIHSFWARYQANTFGIANSLIDDQRAGIWDGFMNGDSDDASARPDGGIDPGGATGPNDASPDRQFMGNIVQWLSPRIRGPSFGGSLYGSPVCRDCDWITLGSTLTPHGMRLPRFARQEGFRQRCE